MFSIKAFRFFDRQRAELVDVQFLLVQISDRHRQDFGTQPSPSAELATSARLVTLQSCSREFTLGLLEKILELREDPFELPLDNLFAKRE